MTRHRINYILARIFGKYHVFSNPHIDGEVRGWMWRGYLYFDPSYPRSEP